MHLKICIYYIANIIEFVKKNVCKKKRKFSLVRCNLLVSPQVSKFSNRLQQDIYKAFVAISKVILNE